MALASNYSIFGLALLLLFQISCKENPLETVEVRDDVGGLERFQRNKKDFAKEGLYQRFSPEGVLLETAQYHQDQLEGEKQYFFSDGSVEISETFKNGQYHGKYRKFYAGGTPKIEQDFVDGVMQGFSIRYYPNGAIQERVTIKNSEEDGPFQEYYESGVLQVEGYYAPSETESALEQGELKEYDESGTLIRIADCKDGRCETRWRKEDKE